MTEEKPTTVHTKKEQLLIASGLVPLLFVCKTQPDYLPLLYSLFVIAYFLSKKHTRQEKLDSNTLSTTAGLFCLNLTLLGLVAETLALFNLNLNRSALNQQPEILLPQLLAIASGGAGFYLGWALSFCLVGKLFGFSLPLALFSGLYPPLLALFPQTISINCWQGLNLLHQNQDFYSIGHNLLIFMTLAGLAYLSSFGRLTTREDGLLSPTKHRIDKLRAILLLSIAMSLSPWCLAWLFLQAVKLCQFNF